MNKLCLLLGLLGCLFFLPNTLNATHIVGGDMTYRCLGNNQYEVSLTIFRDCDTGVPWFDDPAYIGVFDAVNQNLVQTVPVGLNDFLNDTLDIYPPDSCLILSTTACIHTTTYKDTITLTPNNNGYILAYQRCCRNQDIVNIVAPNSTGATYWTYVSPLALTGCNSSATFDNFPLVYLCAGVPLNIDNSATDLDGDSLVYELCTPSNGGSGTNPIPIPPAGPPYQPIAWSGPYNQNNMFGGADPLVIDPQTGLMTGTPQTLGVFLVGVCIKEYRNGELISETRRDFQHIVGTCTPVTVAAFDTVPVQCNRNLEYSFINNSQVVTGTYNWNFDNQGTSTAINPTFTFPDTGVYTVTLVAGLGSPCLDTFTLDVDVNLEAIGLVLSPPPVVCKGDTISLKAINIYEGYADSVGYVWVPDSLIIGGQNTDSVRVIADDNLTIQVEATNNYGCTDSRTVTIDVIDHQAAFIVEPDSCNTSLEVQFTNQSTSNPPNNTYQWFFDNVGSATGTNPVFTFPDTGRYNVTLIVGGNTVCPDTISELVNVFVRGLDILPVATQTACIGDSVWFNTTNIYGQYYSTNYTWSPTNAVAAGQGTDSILVIADSSVQFQVFADNRFGCEELAVFNLDVINVRAAFDTIDLACNTSLAIPFVNSSSSSTGTINYEWQFDNLGGSSATNPTYTFPDTGNYTVTLIANAGGLCPDTTVWDLYLPLYGVDLTAINDQTVCVGDSVWLAVDDRLAQYSSSIAYTWSPVGQILAGQGTDSVLVIPTSSTTIQVTAINSHQCLDTVIAVLDVLEVDANFDTLDVLCNTSLIQPFVNTSTSNGVNSYQWIFGNTGTSLDENPVHTFPDTGTYVVQLIAEVGGLCSDTIEQAVYLPLHGLDLSMDDVQVICRGDTVKLVVENSLDAYTDWVNYQWSPTNLIVSGQGNDTVDAIVDTQRTFYVIGVNSHGCVDTTEATGSIVYISPTLSISATPDSIFVGETAQLQATEDINYVYNWQPDTTLSDYFIDDPEAKPRQTTTYYLAVTNQFGCQTLDSVVVNIRPPICGMPVIFVPNAFSPDGDGYNDVLLVNGNNITSMDMAIYNRWGQKVFETNDQSFGWDGTFKGKALPPDVYGYYMRCVCDDGGELFVKGNITLLK